MTREEVASLITDAAKHGRRVRVAFTDPVITRVHLWRRVDTHPERVMDFIGKPEAGADDFDLHDWMSGLSVVYALYDDVADVEVLS